MTTFAVETVNLTHAYGDRTAVDRLDLRIEPAQIFGILGPNGSGKTTLFRILSTLVTPTDGIAKILGLDVVTDRQAVRRQIGVVFQSPSLDKQLTPRENLIHHGHLYGLRGARLRRQVDEALGAAGLVDRANEYVQSFSGGMRRRVELAKGLLNHPRVLLLDEPSTGLDPAARIEMWRQLKSINAELGVTVLLTTHLMDEADQCTRLAIMQSGRLIACDTPDVLKSAVGGDIITISTRSPQQVRTALSSKLGVEAELVQYKLRIERAAGHEFVPAVISAVPGLIDAVSVGRPTLEDVFIRLTGQGFDEVKPAEQAAAH